MQKAQWGSTVERSAAMPARPLVLLLVLSLSATALAAKQSCWVDNDWWNLQTTGKIGNDNSATCSRATAYSLVSLALRSGIADCDTTTHKCMSADYGGDSSVGIGCVKIGDEDVTCGIYKGLDSAIKSCKYCTGDKCNTCNDCTGSACTCDDGDSVAVADFQSCWVDDDWWNLQTTGGLSNDLAASCRRATAIPLGDLLVRSGQESCRTTTHKCMSADYGSGISSGIGCVKIGDEAVTCEIYKGLDSNIKECTFCTGNQCNTCTGCNGAKCDAACSSGASSLSASVFFSLAAAALVAARLL